MPDGDGDQTYYVISDLHIGGDEQLEEVDFLDELLGFLEDLERTDNAVELIINGDAFGLWEFTKIEGMEKWEALIDKYPELFAQFKATGRSVPITLLPGNHDHDLAAYDEYVDRFAEYNIDLVQEQSISRPVGEYAIHFEHGNQQDPNNRIEDWGNPKATPLGFFYNTRIVSLASQLSTRGRFNWLKDVQAVTPTERMPNWLVSKYFYREMNPFLRYAAVPFLFLFNISIVLALLAGLDVVGLWSFPVDWTQTFLSQFGLAGTAVHLLLSVNVAIAGIILLISIPLGLILRDIRKTVDRFGLFETDLTVDTTEPYTQAAKEIFATEPTTKIFCYGHTHRPKAEQVNGGLLVNTGTWLKRLHRRDVIAGRLPPVFYPSYQLAAVRISAGADGIVVDFEEIKKANPSVEELTLTERFLTLGREPDTELPGQTILSEAESDPGS